MSRLVGFLSNDAMLCDLALKATQQSFVEELQNPSEGWGIGFYEEERALVRKRPARLEGEVDINQLVGDLSTSSFIAQIRHASRGPATPQNTQPFRFRNWLCSHVGTAIYGERGYEAMRNLLPDFMQRSIKGQSDSEVAAFLFLDKLRHITPIERAIIPVGALIEAAQETVKIIEALCCEEAEEEPMLDMLFATGRMLIAIHSSNREMARLTVRGVERLEPSIIAGQPDKRSAYEHFRAIFLAVNPITSAAEWEAIPERSVVVIDEDLRVHTSAL